MKNYPILAKSINPKLNFVAVHMNKYFTDNYGYVYDTYDKKTWPYYLNLAGEPHKLNTEILVYTLETSNKEVMDKNFKSKYPATYYLLMKYEKEYNDLVTEYPMQEGYIRGMLNPVDIQTAIDAEDGDILYYNDEYVEWNEPSLIPRIETTIKLFIERWVITDYMFTDDLYIPMVYSQITSLILNTIYSYRHTSISRFETTGYYQSHMLESNMGIYVPVGVLSNDAKLWLAKNAQYIATNVGKEKIFNLIIERVLNPSGYKVDEVRISPTKYIDVKDDIASKTYVKNKSVLYRTKKSDADFQAIPIPLSEVLDKTRTLSQTTDNFSIGGVTYEEMEKRLYQDTAYSERSKVYEIHSDKKYQHIDGVSAELVLESVMRYLTKTQERFLIRSTTSIAISLSSSELLTTLMFYLFKQFGMDTNVVIDTLIFDLPLHDEVCTQVPSSHADINYEKNLIDELVNGLYNPTLTGIKDYSDRVLNNEKKIICETTNSHSPYSAAVISYNYYRGFNPTPIGINPQGKTLQNLVDELPRTMSAEGLDYYKEILLILEQLTGYKDVNVTIRDNLRAVFKFIKRLTSYTITPMLDDDILNAINTRHEVGAITDTTTILISDAHYDCLGAVPVLNTYGDDQLTVIKAFDNKDIMIEDSDMAHIPVVIIGENYNDRIRIVKHNIVVT